MILLEHASAGEAILLFGGRITGRRSSGDFYAMRLGKRMFLTGSSDLDNYVNHSCTPTCRVDFDKLSLVALRDLSPGVELTYNYCTSEYDIDPPYRFRCKCASPNCMGTVKGFRHLDAPAKERLLHISSSYIRMRHLHDRGSRESG